MCGFTGAVGDGARNASALTRQGLERIRHRGPDDEGLESGPWWTLGFRRLSILDLTPGGHQPMYDPSRRVCLVMNGEIYNYLELKRTLEETGWVFRSTSDTEVMLALYVSSGGDMQALLSRCNGMFAVAVVDLERQRLVLARDRLGVKPLFYARTGRGLVFGSEIKGIEPLLPSLAGLDFSALSAYLRLGFVPGWLCAYKGISKLPPGHWGEWSLETADLTLHRYWQPAPGRCSGLDTEARCVEAVHELLTDATAIRLRSDVPVGLFLSGGIDSGLVSSYVASGGNNSVKAHTIRFPGWADDESGLAGQTASHLGLQLEIHDSDVPRREELVSTIAHFDEPFADSSAIVTDLVCRHTRSHATVVLTGDGGDESFAGYGTYRRARICQALKLLPDAAVRLGGRLLASAPSGRLERIGRMLGLARPVRDAWLHLYPFDRGLERLLSPDVLGNEAFEPAAIDSLLPAAAAPHSLDRAQLTDLQLYMVDDVLTKVDMMSMRHSIEIRSPFLDYRMVELGLSIPPRLRLAGGETKHILRRLARRRLPESVTGAPKRGFGVPIERYFFDGRRLRDETLQLISPLRETGWFNWSGLEKHLEGAARTALFANQVYKLVCLGVWASRKR